MRNKPDKMPAKIAFGSFCIIIGTIALPMGSIGVYNIWLKDYGYDLSYIFLVHLLLLIGVGSISLSITSFRKVLREDSNK